MTLVLVKVAHVVMAVAPAVLVPPAAVLVVLPAIRCVAVEATDVPKGDFAVGWSVVSATVHRKGGFVAVQGTLVEQGNRVVGHMIAIQMVVFAAVMAGIVLQDILVAITGNAVRRGRLDHLHLHLVKRLPQLPRL
jgi:hypothetical protein